MSVRDIPYMGVIYVVAEAMKLGFYNGHPEWCNLGQGQPEIGEMEGAPPRLSHITMEPGDHAYGPINGTGDARAAVAAHYNRLFRGPSASRFRDANVSLASGGRLVLSRIFAALGSGRVGYQTPDYTAYEDMIDYHRHRITPVHVPVSEADGFAMSPATLEAAIRRHDLRAFVLSNPCNPTGRVIAGDALRACVRVARETGCLLVLDEFYSHFIYTADGGPGEGPVSAAAFLDDVDRDPVVIVDGLTKSFRYPGWRIGWAVAPASIIETLGRAASAIDGGPPQALQRAAIAVLEPARADQETRAVRQVFARKRRLMVDRLAAMHIMCAHPTEGTFYVWASIAGLPAPFNDAEVFFRRALEERVMTVPGAFFDVNPGKARTGQSPYAQWVRFSFGPAIDNVTMGLDRLEAMLSAEAHVAAR
jgi:aspartate/methionine/tyrosine aminotransferase